MQLPFDLRGFSHNCSLELTMNNLQGPLFRVLNRAERAQSAGSGLSLNQHQPLWGIKSGSHRQG
jgi:hypothetical protein